MRQFLSTPVAACVLACVASAQKSLFEIQGPEPGAQYGRMVSDVGDVDGNGFDDFLVGEPLSSANGFESGRAVLVSGRTGAPIYAPEGSGAGDRFGYGVGGAGLVDHDLVPDFVVGAPLEGGHGAAIVYSGKTGSELWHLTGSPGSLFGAFVDGAGDVNADERDDWVVSAPVEGVVRVFSGADGSELHELSGFEGTAPNGVRLEVHAAGDVDRDGYADILVGEPFYDSAIGRVQVFSGRTGGVLHSWIGESELSALFGYSVDALDDVNADGYPDILVGISHKIYPPFAAGEAQVYSGKGGELLWSMRGPEQSATLGRAVSNAGDVNGDGIDDLLLGAPYYDDGVGLASLVSGRSGLVLYEFHGNDAHFMPKFAYALSGGGDVNGDGLADLVIAAPHEASDSGVVRVFAGNDLFLRLQPEGQVAVGETLELTTTGGMDGAPSRLFLVSIDGVPVRRKLDSGPLGPGGERSFSLAIPPSARGLELGFRAFATHAGKEVDSRTELIRVQ